MLCLELVYAFVFAVTVIFAESPPLPTLKILPSGDKIHKQLGAKFALACKPDAQDPTLMSQLEWSDPRNRRIESTNRDSPIYVQKRTGEPGLLLIFSGLTANQAGDYTCSGFYANTEPLKATVTVATYENINFADAPESQYPKVGQDYIVKCVVKGNPAPDIEWTKNDRTITTDDNKYVVVSDGLLVKNIRESDDGVYKCTAYVVSTGEINTRNIKVEVLVPPKINPMAPISVIEGETATVKCVATGKPPPNYTWIKQTRSQDLSKTDRFDVKKNTGDLIINRVEFYDDDIYKCVAENPADRVESSVKINVLVKPKIFELLNVTSPLNTETKLICKTRGRPTPKVIFRKLSSKEPFKFGQQPEDKRIIIEQEVFEDKSESFGTLSVLNLNRSDDGLYECIAENTAGTSYKNGHITVEFPPTFERTKNFPPAWAWENKPGNITCIPEAIPNATIIWKLQDLEIQDSPNFKKIGNGPVSSLIVNPLNNIRFYTKYECIATNKHGTASIWLPLREARVPEHINQIRPQTITATTIKFTINPPAYFDGLPIRSFSVQYRRDIEHTWDSARNHTWSFHAPYILENLIPENTYHFRFAARNDVGLGPWVNAETITMPRRSEPAEPKIIVPSHILEDDNTSDRIDRIAVSPYADHFELRWNVPNDNGDPIDSYLIRYCVVQKINGEWRDSDCSEEIRQSVQHTSYELSDLKADTIYKIELRAHNAIGSSSPAQIKVKTARGADIPIPYEPQITNIAIIGMVVGVIILILFAVDIACFAFYRAGILAAICNKSKSKHEEEDPKLGREEREPLKPDERMNGERVMSVEYDGRQVYSKSGEIIGKHSAV